MEYTVEKEVALDTATPRPNSRFLREDERAPPTAIVQGEKQNEYWPLHGFCPPTSQPLPPPQSMPFTFASSRP